MDDTGTGEQLKALKQLQSAHNYPSNLEMHLLLDAVHMGLNFNYISRRSDHFWFNDRHVPHTRPLHLLIPACSLPPSTLSNLHVSVPCKRRCKDFYHMAFSRIPLYADIYIERGRSKVLELVHAFLSSSPMRLNLFLHATLILAQTTLLLRYVHRYNYALSSIYPRFLHEGTQSHYATHFMTSIIDVLWCAASIVDISLFRLNFQIHTTRHQDWFVNKFQHLHGENVWTPSMFHDSIDNKNRPS